MTDRELMRQVLDALDSDNPDIQLRTAVALRNRMSQPEPLFSTPDVTPEVTPHVIDCPRCGHCCPQWVGLTDEEVQEIMEKTVANCSELDDFTGYTARLTWKNWEAKLKEKNGG